MEEHSPDPPFETAYEDLFATYDTTHTNLQAEEHELPLIDLSQLDKGDLERQTCKKQIAAASREWGFFQVINHGIPSSVQQTMWEEQVKLLRKPFAGKANCKDLKLLEGSYRWGTRAAQRLDQLSWLEAFHVQMNDILSAPACRSGSLGSAVAEYAARIHALALKMAAVLAEELGCRLEASYFEQTCRASTCYLRFNRYPPCPKFPGVNGIVPHTDSDFLTVLHQDSVGGLQLVKDGKWIAVRPVPGSLIVNIGDLFQAWSNDVYRSVEHRVVTNGEKERFSMAYFLCPSHETVIPSHVYNSFTFGDFRQQVTRAVATYGTKIGLPAFLRPNEHA